MKKTIQKIEIAKIKVDEDLYPRTQMNWQTAYDYAQSMRAGAKFPPIVVALFKGSFILVDGNHRLNANKQLKETEIEAEINIGWNRKKIFEEAIKANISHGKVLSPYEKRRIALKLRQLRYSDKSISQLIQVPFDKLSGFVEQRLVNTLTGETIVKSEVKHLAGYAIQESAKDFEKESKRMFANDQLNLIANLLDLISKRLIDLDNAKVINKLTALKIAIEKALP